MPTAYKMLGLFGLLSGGAALGLGLATFADPVPRQALEEPVVVGARVDLQPAPSYVFIETGPEDLSPPTAPDGYAPHWVDAGGEPWPYPEPETAVWVPVPFPTLAEIDAKLDARLEEDVAPPEVVAARAASTVRTDATAPASARLSAPRRGEDSSLAALY